MKLVAVWLCVLALSASCMVAPAAAGHRKMGGDWVRFGIQLLCVPQTETLLEKHEGRHECVYELPNGDKAVGVGYNLDDEKDTRRSELKLFFADYDKVYNGKACLNNIQISGLLGLDTRRALNRAANSIKSLGDQCCDIQSVFGDIQHSGGKQPFEEKEFQDVIEAVSAKEWDKAAEKLEQTQWCKENEKRCRDDRRVISEGCKGPVAGALIDQVTNLVQ